MADSIFKHAWRPPWSRIVALAVLLGLWITAVVPGCSSDWLASRALEYLTETKATLNPEEYDDRQHTYFE
jgi:hypothetical protein